MNRFSPHTIHPVFRSLCTIVFMLALLLILSRAPVVHDRVLDAVFGGFSKTVFGVSSGSDPNLLDIDIAILSGSGFTEGAPLPDPTPLPPPPPPAGN